jgi:Protein of unknown function (DUF3570)
MHLRTHAGLLLVAALALAAPSPPGAAVLPEDRADALYHRYEGGGVTVDGPSLLVRKKVGENYSVAANYYMDFVSSASIDVLTQASPYKEERRQASLGFDMLNGRTQYSVAYTNSDESDYTANTASFDLSQSLFGDLTTVSFGFSRAWDDVSKQGDPAFHGTVDRWAYRVSLDQIVTPQLSTGLVVESISDEGYLNNPYRSARYLDPDVAAGFAWEPEVYPNTRNSTAVSVNAQYFVWYRAAIHGMYRYFTDSWGVDASTVRVGYTHPIGDRWIVEFNYRWYDQSAADFYSDLFPRENSQNFVGRDKELSTFQSQMFTVGATWQLPPLRWGGLERSTVNLFYDYALYDYADFRDILKGGAPGEEPLYNFDADVIRLFISAWF